MKQITKNVFIEGGMLACNLGLIVTEEGTVMIDTPIKPSDSVKWKEDALKNGALKYLILTEDHGDHVNGGFFFPAEHIVSSISTRVEMAKMPSEKAAGLMTKLDPAGVPLLEDYKLRVADITFDETMEIYLGNHTIVLFPLPGHTERVIGVYIPEERIVFASDCLFHACGSFLTEASPEDWAASLTKLKSLDVDFVVPGHGEVCTKDYLDKQADVIRSWVDVVKLSIQKGISEEEAIASLKSPDPYPVQKGLPFDNEFLRKAAITRLYQLYSDKP